MIGAIIGDIVGSVYEFDNLKSKEFDLYNPSAFFTDDTVCTVAVADWLLASEERGFTSSERFAYMLQEWCRRYPDLSYGSRFSKWIKHPIPYDSFGNGAAMRISPVGLYFSDEEDVFFYSDMATRVSHNHPDGIYGARAVSLAVYLAKTGASKVEIKKQIQSKFGYDLSQSCDVIRKTNKLNETCQVTVPQALICFLESVDFIDAIRLAISIGGDSDTIAAIAGSVAEAFYKKIPKSLIEYALEKLTVDLRDVIFSFYKSLNEKSLPFNKAIF